MNNDLEAIDAFLDAMKQAEEEAAAKGSDVIYLDTIANDATTNTEEI